MTSLCFSYIVCIGIPDQLGLVYGSVQGAIEDLRSAEAVSLAVNFLNAITASVVRYGLVVL